MAERDQTILHQQAVEDVVDKELSEVSDHEAIADLEAPSNTYVQAEATTTTDTVNEILAVLRDAGLIPTEE